MLRLARLDVDCSELCYIDKQALEGKCQGSTEERGVFWDVLLMCLFPICLLFLYALGSPSGGSCGARTTGCLLCFQW